MMQAVVDVGVHGVAPPNGPIVLGYPTVGYALKYVTSADVRVCSDPAAEDSLAASRACSKLGIAIAAIMRMIATTINNSISENPLVELIKSFPRATKIP